MTRKPDAASASAMPRPRPRVPPVTRTLRTAEFSGGGDGEVGDGADHGGHLVRREGGAAGGQPLVADLVEREITLQYDVGDDDPAGDRALAAANLGHADA